MVKIFDSATHPVINNSWLNPKFNDYCDIEILQTDMKKYDIDKAFAIGMKGIGDYNLEKYIKFLSPYKNLIPIAFCENLTELKKIKELGYKGIKLHPRISNIEPDDDRIFDIIKEANKINLIVLYCGFLGVTDKFIKKIEDSKLIFLHTGGKNLKDTFEKLKDKKNILLDLSYTLANYTDLDDYIKDLFNKFSNRLCIGSDHPEVRLSVLRERFEYFSQGLDKEKTKNIAYKNLENLLKEYINE